MVSDPGASTGPGDGVGDSRLESAVQIAVAGEPADFEIALGQLQADIAGVWRAYCRWLGALLEDVRGLLAEAELDALYEDPEIQDLGRRLGGSIDLRSYDVGHAGPTADRLIADLAQAWTPALDLKRAGLGTRAAVVVVRSHWAYVDQHDAWTELLQLLLAALDARAGHRAFESALRRQGRLVLGGLADLGDGAEPERGQILRLLASAMRGHPTGEHATGGFAVHEKDDHVVFEFDLCGSGGRLLRAAAAGAPLARVAASPASGGVAEVPHYCTHCIVFHEAVATDLLGSPTRVTDLDPSRDGACRWIVPKHRATFEPKADDLGLRARTW